MCPRNISQNICELKGPFANGSFAAGAGIDASVDSFYGTTVNGRPVIGGGFTAGGGVGGGASTILNLTQVFPISGRKLKC